MGTDNLHTFVAIRGIQAGREYYVAMVSLNVIPKIFLFDEPGLPAELKAQRTLNRARVPDIARYLVENSRNYVLSSITASVDAKVVFEPFGDAANARNVGRLLVPMTARFLINDGQHRRAALEEALKDRPELGEETISVVIFVDGGLKRSQQMFADLNRHAVRPTQSLAVLYDHRDSVSQLSCRLANRVTVFKNLTEMEKTTVPIRSNKLHTLSSIYQATRTLLTKSKRSSVSPEDEQLAFEFWQEVGSCMPDWQLAAAKKVSCDELRREYVHAHGVTLQALGFAGAALLAQEPRGWKTKLKALRKVDWSRTNGELWEGRALVGGRVSKSHVHVTLTAILLKQCFGVPLTSAEKQLDGKLARNRIAA